MTEDLIFRFVGYDLLGGVLRNISDGLEGLMGIGQRSARSLSDGFNIVGNAAMGLGVGMVSAGAAIVGAMGASAMAAANFQSQLTLLMTHAGASQQVMQELGGWILKVAGQLGFDPTSLAQAAYHVQSVMTSLPESMRTVANEEALIYASSQLAAIGHANLEDSVNAVTKAFVVYGKDGYSANDITAIFNKTVGEGNMRLQELNAAFASGLLPVAEQAGVSLQSLGATLATMTDEGIPAARSAIYLRSALIQMTIPSKAAAAALSGIGVATNDVQSQIGSFNQVLVKAGIIQTDVAKELQKTGSLGQTVQWLADKLREAGVSGQDAGALLAKAFGGIRSGTGVVTLYNNLNGLLQKEKDATEATKDWSNQWDKFTQSDPTFQVKQLQASWDTLVIILGDAFLPVMLKVLSVITPIVTMIGQWIAKNSDLVASSVQGLAVFLLVGGAIVFVAGVIGRIIGFILPIIEFFGELGSALEAVALGSTAAGGAVGTAGEVIASAFGGPITIAIAVIGALIAIGVLLVTHWNQIKAVALSTWGIIAPYVNQALSFIRGIIQKELNVIMGVWNAHHAQIMAVAMAAWSVIKVILFGILLAIVVIIGLFVVSIAVAIATVIGIIMGIVWVIGKAIDAFNWLKSSGVSIMGSFFSWLGSSVNNLLGMLGSFFSWLGGSIHNLLVMIGSFFSWLGTTASNAWSEFARHPGYWLGFIIGLIINFQMKATKAILEFFVHLVETAYQKFQEFNAAFRSFIAWLIPAIWNLFVWILNTAYDKWEAFNRAFRDTVSRLPQELINLGTQLYNAWQNAVNALVRAAVDGAVNFYNGWQNVVRGLPGAMVNLGRDIASGLWEGIKSMGSWLAGNAAGFVKGIIDGMKAAIWGGSPSMLAAMELGVPISQGIAMGMQSDMPKTQNVMNQSVTGLIKNSSAPGVNASNPINLNQNQTQTIELKIGNDVLERVIIQTINNWREINEFP